MSKICEVTCFGDPQGPEAFDHDDFEAILNVAIGNQRYDLMDTLISSRYFGMQITPSERFGRELSNLIPDFREHFQQTFYKHRELLTGALRELARLRDEK